MLTILIDSGNSRIKLCALHDQTVLDYLVIRHVDISKIPVWFKHFKQPIQAAYGVNVAGSVLASQLQSCMPCPIQWLSSEAQTLLMQNHYDPSLLGADRWYALLGLRHHCPQGPALLVTMGTATTIDALDQHNHFLGGLIVPGTLMMTRSLSNATANLPKVIIDDEHYLPPSFPTNTVDAIRGGIIVAQCGAILRQWLKLRLQVQTDPALYLSGGARHDILPELRHLLAENVGYEVPLQEIRFPVLDGLRLYVQSLST